MKLEPLAAKGRRFLSDLSWEPCGRRFRVVTEMLLPLAVGLLLTWWIRTSGFDLGAQQWIHRIGGGEWTLGDHSFWKWLYRLAPLPATVVVLGAISALALSWAKPALRPWRRVFVFLILSGLIGPGLITNALLKEYWGRPRPREVIEFGGRSEFEPVLTYDGTSEGLSFPCGHATMGFYFFSLYFLLRRHRRFEAEAVAFASISFGGLLALARMTQGAHFFSDGLWAGLVCWYTPMALYYALGLDRRLLRPGHRDASRMPLSLKLGLGLGGACLLFLVLLGSPYDEKRTYTPMNEYVRSGPLTVRLELAKGRVEIVPGSEFRIHGEAKGHGFPTSKIGRNYLETQQKDGGAIAYTERISGWLKELDARLTVELPWNRMRRLKVDTGEAEVRLVLGEGEGRTFLEVNSGEGSVSIESGGAIVRGAEGDSRVERPARVGGANSEESVYRLEVGEAFRGTIRLVEGKGR
ncbi:MAG: phosphatase PAP2 family protein [Verrucomicrobiae bacterium]|nr:phosphatase PAP2 family protein [Verrucomicrobiae bacterium]